MEFRIADSFMDSLARLTSDEQRTAKLAAFEFQADPAQPGHQVHKVERSKDPNFWSARVSRDIRIIIHKTEQVLVLCYVAHHDDAYRWAERRRLETHPKTGAAQIVEIRQVVREIEVPMYVEPAAAPTRPLPFDTIADEDLLAFGVPDEWIPEVRSADEDGILEVASHLPAEAAEALLELATGGRPQPTAPAPAGANPFEHPDAQRRFRTLTDQEELARALDYPWERWSVFLHPGQRDVVERDYSGPARVAGSAGTGKTVVALHRAVHLARTSENARVLLTTFSDTLASALLGKLRVLISGEPRLGERIEVHTTSSIARRLYERNFGTPSLATSHDIEDLVAGSATELGVTRFTQQFLVAEWNLVVDEWQLDTWEAYRDVLRLGRRRRLPEGMRQELWALFDIVRAKLAERNLITEPQILQRLAEHFKTSDHHPFEHVVVDEAQDVGVAQLRFLAALASNRGNALFFAGDLGQRIFQQPFSWSALGVDVRGRSRTLKVNYRTSHQIRSQADRLLDPEVADVDGYSQERRGTVSVFNGPQPNILLFDTAAEESEHLGNWLTERISIGLSPEEVAIFVRSEDEVSRATAAVDAAGMEHQTIEEAADSPSSKVIVGTMHLAKGMEFRAVAVIACDEEVIPSQDRIESIAEDGELEEVYNTERHLLYVACTRARDFLLITGVRPGSEFLADLGV